MKHTTQKIKKPYISPHLKVHKLVFEGNLLGNITTVTPGQLSDDEWNLNKAPIDSDVLDDTYYDE